MVGSYLSCASVSFVLRQCFLFLEFCCLTRFPMFYRMIAYYLTNNVQLKVGHSSNKQSCQALFSTHYAQDAFSKNSWQCRKIKIFHSHKLFTLYVLCHFFNGSQKRFQKHTQKLTDLSLNKGRGRSLNFSEVLPIFISKN
jgi:hypothetical protein